MSKPADRPYADLLTARPVRNEAARCERRRPSETVVRVPLRKRWFMRAPFTWLLPLSRERVVSLDALGTEVWDRCDGRHTTRQIINDFAKHHHLSFHEARVSICQYLQQLMERRLVVLVGQPMTEERP
jgi:hypothetical protein